MTTVATGENIAASGARPWLDELRATALLAWPMILTNAAQTLFSATDVVLMGRIGPDALAAGALAANLYFGVLIFGIGLVNAVSPLVAHEIGHRRHSVRDVRRTVRQGFWVALTISVPMCAVLWFGEALLLAMGQEPRLAEAAGIYLRALLWAGPSFLIYLVLRSFLAALERPGWALIVGAAAVPLNGVLAYVLMFGKLGLPALGLVGAGIATSLASFAMVLGLAAVVTLDRRLRRYHLFGRFWRADWSRYRRLWALGAPIGATLAFEVTIFNAAALLMGLISATALAAHSIAIQIASLAFMIPLGLGQAATVRVGLARGSGDLAGARLAGWTAFNLSLVFALAMAAVMVLVPRLLIGVFLDLDDPANRLVVELTVGFLALAGLFQLADAAQAVGAGMLRGLQDTRVPMLYALLGYWGVGAPLGVLLGFKTELAGNGIWIGLAAGLAVVAVLMLVRWMQRTRPVPARA
ncbi:MAG TPA: MATE family efflux transporter [Beijerinckiaceae bacterium]|jgi:MATE family multidrug resistance protein